MKKTSFMLWLLKTIGAGTLALLFLNGITFIYSYSTVHSDNPSGATDSHWEPYSYASQIKEGHSFFRRDADGFNNAFPIPSDGIDILLMGSSHMQGSNVPQKKNVGTRLNILLPKVYTYNIGMDGHTMYRCVHNLKNAMKTYIPKDCVILETADINLSIEEMRQAMGNQYEKIVSYDQGILLLIQKRMPCIKLIYNQLLNWKDSTCAKEMRLTIPYDKQYWQVLESFLQFAADSTEGIPLIIVYHPKVTINKEGNLIINSNEEYVDLFNDICEDKNIIFVDISKHYIKAFKENFTVPYGFYNTRVGQGHLNSAGCEIIAEELVRALIDNGIE